MNVSLNFDAETASIKSRQFHEQQVARLQTELDALFENGINTPEDVLEAYTKMVEYRMYAGQDYKIIKKENTIV